MSFHYTYISLGAGLQSTALLVCSERGLHGVPKADVAIFADTGDEPAWVYEHLDVLGFWAKTPIRVVRKGCLSDDMIARHRGEKSRLACIPAFTKGDDGREAMLRRQCTREYKIEPIEKMVRELLGYKPRQRIRESVQCLLGISVDEASRMRPSRTRWITNAYPLVDANLTRGRCAEIIEAAGLPVPKKSSCVFCPYHSDGYWQTLKQEHPGEFAKAVAFDREIRDMSMSGMERPAFLHRTLQPLDQVDFDERTRLPLFDEECDGYCGV